jgi:hypothetical protein
MIIEGSNLWEINLDFQPYYQWLDFQPYCQMRINCRPIKIRSGRNLADFYKFSYLRSFDWVMNIKSMNIINESSIDGVEYINCTQSTGWIPLQSASI